MGICLLYHEWQCSEATKMPIPTRHEGAEAAGDAQVSAAFRKLIAEDPDIQRVIQRVWGTGQRPSDTPGHLEGANHAASQEIKQILARKGVTLPDRTFINPRSGALEGHRGWSGLSGWQRAAVIAAAAATGVGAGAALGAFGGAAAGAGGAGGAGSAGAGIGAGTAGGTAGLGAGLGVTAGLPAGMAGVGATGVAAGAGVTGGYAGLGAGATGGMGSWLSRAGDLAPVLSGASQTNAADRFNNAAMNLQQDRATADIYGTQQRSVFDRAQTELAQKQFAMQAPTTRARQTGIGDLLANVSDVQITPPSGVRMGNITGGLRPSVFGPNTRQAGQELSRQSLMALLEKSDQPTSPLTMITPPTIRPTPRPSGAERAFDWLGTGAGIAGAVGELYRR